MSKIINDLKNIQNEMIKLVGRVNNLANIDTFKNVYNETWTPKCDVFETEEKFIIILDLAGVEKEDIKIVSTNEYIKISGIRKFNITNPNICYYNMEIDSGQFERTIPFPDSKFKQDSPKVVYEKGFLTIEFKIIAKSDDEIKYINID